MTLKNADSPLSRQELGSILESWGQRQIQPLQEQIKSLQETITDMSQKAPSPTPTSDSSSESHNHADCETCLAQTEAVQEAAFKAGQQALATLIDEALLAAGGETLCAQITALIDQGIQKAYWNNQPMTING